MFMLQHCTLHVAIFCVVCLEQWSTQLLQLQITASVTFLPLLADPCTFDLLVYTDRASSVPIEWYGPALCISREDAGDFLLFHCVVSRSPTALLVQGGVGPALYHQCSRREAAILHHKGVMPSAMHGTCCCCEAFKYWIAQEGCRCI